MLATNINEVVTALEQIMEDCAATNNRLGYFAALYYKVTCRVRDGIANGEFENGERMERLDVSFANRYIQAYQQWALGESPSASWQIAFKAAKGRHALVLQHLLLGMNAHINLDLGIATVATAGANPLALTRADFNAINPRFRNRIFYCVAIAIFA